MEELWKAALPYMKPLLYLWFVKICVRGGMQSWDGFHQVPYCIK